MKIDSYLSELLEDAPPWLKPKAASDDDEDEIPGEEGDDEEDDDTEEDGNPFASDDDEDSDGDEEPDDGEGEDDEEDGEGEPPPFGQPAQAQPGMPGAPAPAMPGAPPAPGGHPVDQLIQQVLAGQNADQLLWNLATHPQGDNFMPEPGTQPMQPPGQAGGQPQSGQQPGMAVDEPIEPGMDPNDPGAQGQQDPNDPTQQPDPNAIDPQAQDDEDLAAVGALDRDDEPEDDLNLDQDDLADLHATADGNQPQARDAIQTGGVIRNSDGGDPEDPEQQAMKDREPPRVPGSTMKAVLGQATPPPGSSEYFDFTYEGPDPDELGVTWRVPLYHGSQDRFDLLVHVEPGDELDQYVLYAEIVVGEQPRYLDQRSVSAVQIEDLEKAISELNPDMEDLVVTSREDANEPEQGDLKDIAQKLSDAFGIALTRRSTYEIQQLWAEGHGKPATLREGVNPTAAQLADQIRSATEQLFRSVHFRCVRRFMISDGVSIQICNVPPGSPQLDLYNAKTRIMIDITGPSTYANRWQQDAPAPDLVSVSSSQGSRDVKFRALNNTTPEKAVAYVIRWLKANAQLFQITHGEKVTPRSMNNYLGELLGEEHGTGKLDSGVRNKVNADLDKLLTNRYYPSTGRAANEIQNVLAKHGLELADSPQWYTYGGHDKGRQTLRLAWSHKQDPFSPDEIENSVLAVTWHQMQSGNYEVVAYVS